MIPEPAAPTEKLVPVPAQTIPFDGLEVMDGKLFTVKMAGSEVSAPQDPVTTALYW